MNKKFGIFSAMVLFWLLTICSAQAISVNFKAIDLADTLAGEDLWQYTYTVYDYTFIADTGFTIYFDCALYGPIEPFPSPPNTDWDVLTWNPDPGIPDDGVYDAYALSDKASLAEPFTVSIVWLGAGTPGAQLFEVYDGFTLDIIESGYSKAVQMSPVPEPVTLLLLGTGMLGLVGYRKKRFGNYAKN